MKTAKDYPVTFPYGATTAPYSPAHPHRGEDRSMPLRTPVTVNNVLIGYAGTTGRSSGVHTHTQKVANGAVQHPRGGGFTVPSPVTITETGYKSDIGNYVRYRDANGVIWSIFHFDEVVVKQGLLKEIDVPTKTEVRNAFKELLDRAPTAEQLASYIKKEKWVLYKNIATTLKNRDVANKKTISEQASVIKAQKAEIEALKAQVGDNSKWETLKALIRELIGVK